MSIAAHAAVIGPNHFGYTARHVPSSWDGISAAGTQMVAVSNADHPAIGVNLGFHFSISGNSHTELLIATNG